MTAKEPNATESTSHLAGSSIAWNSLLNLATSFVIIGLNFVFVPVMLHVFGTEFYGVLSITWLVLANFAFLDFGFSRASAKYVAQELGRGRPDEAALWTVTAVFSQLVLGAVGALAVWVLAPLIVSGIHVRAENTQLVIHTVRLFALCIPLDFAGKSLLGVLQAGQRFDWVNGLTVFSSLSTFAAYGLGIISGASFKVVVDGLFVVRLANLALVYWGATKVLPDLTHPRCVAGLRGKFRSHVMTLARYGIWITMAAIAVPLLLYCDQWMITVLVGVSLLPYYTVPSNLLWRVAVVPTSLTSTLFPAFSALEARADWDRIENYFVRAHRYLLIAIIPILFVLFCWGREILHLWIGRAFSDKSATPLRWLILGFLIGLLAPVAGALLEASGRPDLLVKVYLAELPFNFAVVWYLTKFYGISGAALSYTVRTIVETGVLYAVLFWIVPFSPAKLLKQGIVKPMWPVVPMSVAAFLLRGATIKDVRAIVITLAIVLSYGVYAYIFVLDKIDVRFFVEMYQNKTDRLRAKIFGRRLTLTGAEES